MKLIVRATLITLALTSAVTHAETLSVEQILAMQEARNAAHASQERTDNALIIVLCSQDKTSKCLTATRKLVMEYKKGIIELHELDKKFAERMASGYGVELNDTDPNSYPSGSLDN